VVDLCMRGSSTGYEPLSGVDAAERGRGLLVALAARTGKVLWAHRLGSPPFGCATAAGNVVFTTTYRGAVLALSQATGRVLWRAREPAGINGCPAVAGGLLVVPAGAEPSTIATPTPVVDAYAVQ
jgi:outer membrane protein assembly factor BamB